MANVKACGDVAVAATHDRVYPGKSPYPMLPVDDCISTVLRFANTAVEAINVSLEASLGQVLAQDVFALAPVPAFPTSIMDGFAVRASDGPGRFPVDHISGATAGGQALGPVPCGHIRYITTGAPLPEGTDAVVKVEDSSETWQDGQLFINIAVSSKPGANIRKIGSDTAAGELVLRAGTPISAGEIGVLAGMGLAEIPVHRKPLVAILSTGDELVDVSQIGKRDQQKGQIVDCNRPMLCALVKEAGADSIDCGIVKDEPGQLRQTVISAVASADIVVTSGGVSRGSKDLVKDLLGELGEVHFGEMCMKPGKPTTFATIPKAASQDNNSKPAPCLFFALPGNPVSCFVTFRLLVVPALERLRGRPPDSAVYPRVQAELAQPIEMDPVRPEYHRAVARWQDGRILAESTGFQRSSRIASVASANCFLEVPNRPGVLPQGTVLPALLLPTPGGGSAGSICAGADSYPCKAPAEAFLVPTRGVATSGVSDACKAPAEAQAADGSQPKTSCNARTWNTGLLTLGTEGANMVKEVTAALQAAGVDGPIKCSPTESSRIGGAVLELLGGTDEGSKCDLVLVLANLGLGQADATIASAIEEVLERDAPGIGDAVLRSGLQRTPLMMLQQVVAGVRDNTLIVTIPSAAPAEVVKCIVPLVPLVTI